MGFRDAAVDDVQQANENSNEQEELEQIEVDMSDIAFTHSHPTSIVSGTMPDGEGNPIIRFRDAQHNDGRLDQGYLGFVLDDPSVVADEDEGTEGTVVLDVHESNEIRVFDENDSQTSVGRGNGFEAEDQVRYGDRSYEGELVDGFDEDRIILIVNGVASKSVGRKVDVNGAPMADMDEDTGRDNGGLIEYAPDGTDTDVSSRYTRDPELRDELYGTEVAFMIARREELDDDYAELVEEGERRAMNWYSVFAEGDDGMESLEMVEGEPVGSSYLEWRFDPDVGPNRLPDDDYEFVMTYVDEGLPTDEETIRTNIEQNTGSLSDDFDADAIVERVQSEA